MGARFSKRGAHLVAAALALWAAAAFWVGPLLIRRAYQGKSLPVLNDIFAGRGVHSVDFYLDAWRSAALLATGLLSLGLLLGYLGHRFAGTRRKVIEKAVGGRPALGAGTLLWYAAGWGFLAGLSEAVYQGVRQYVTQRPAAGFYWEIFWMAPLASGLATVLLAVVLVALGRAGGTQVGVWKATVLFAFCAFYAVIRSEGIPLHPAAAVIFSLGLATVAARVAVGRGGSLEHFIPRTRPYLLGTAGTLMIIAVLNLPSIAERRALAGRPAPRGDLPNVLLIILDTVRAANLSLYGYHRETTPEIDEWAKSGIVFERAFATAPWTLPTHASMFTGRYNFELETGFSRPLGETYPTLAEVLADHGYATGAFTANPMYTTSMSGLDRGFDRYEDFYRVSLDQMLRSSWLSGFLTGALSKLTGRSSAGQRDAADVTRDFLQWIDAPRERPFFAFLNFFDAHAPYESPEPFSSAFAPPPPVNWWTFYLDRWEANPDSAYTSDELTPWVALYDGALRYIDHHVGLIRDSLSARGILQNTLVIITSDHGEMWGEHGESSHANSLYLPVLRVPLVMSFPKRLPEAMRIEAGVSVSVRAIPATVMSLIARAEESPFAETPLQTQWTSLEDPSAPLPILAELSHEEPDVPAWAPVSRGDMKALFQGRWHYILNGDGMEELYNIESDPDELRNLAHIPTFHGVLSRLRTALDSIVPDGETGPAPGDSVAPIDLT